MARTETQYANQGQAMGYNRNFKRAYVDFQGVESDPNKLRARQLQIDIGKQTPGYKAYCKQVPKEMRRRNSVMPPEPHTPDPTIKCSKRFFDGQIKKWRRDLHWYDPRDWEEEQYGTAELKPRGQAAASHHNPDASSQPLPTTPLAGPSAIPIERATPEVQQLKVTAVDKATQAPTPPLQKSRPEQETSGGLGLQSPLTDITNDAAAALKKESSQDPFNDDSLRNFTWADDTADDTAIEGVPGSAPAHLRPIRTIAPGAAANHLLNEGDGNDKENSQQCSASASRGNHSSHATAATGVSTATSEQGTGYKASGNLAWEKLTSSTDGVGSGSHEAMHGQLREGAGEADKKVASKRLIPDKLVQMQRQALPECVTFKPVPQMNQGSWRQAAASGQASQRPQAAAIGHYAKAVMGPPAAPMRESSHRPSEPRLRSRGNGSSSQSWGPSGKIPGLPPGFMLEVDKQRTSELLQAAGVRDPQRFVSEADKERLRLLRGEPNYLQNQINVPGQPRQPRPIPIEVPSQAELPGFSRPKPWHAAYQQGICSSPNGAVYQEYDGLNDNDFLPGPSEARVDDSAAARYRIRSRTPKQQQPPRTPGQAHSGRSSSASGPSLRSSGHTSASGATLATESVIVAESVGMTELVEDDASVATWAGSHRPQSANPSVRVSLKVVGEEVQIQLKQVSWASQPMRYRKGLPPRRGARGGRQAWGHGQPQGNFRSRSAGPLQQLPEQPRMAVRVFQAGQDELQSVQPLMPKAAGYGWMGQEQSGVQRLGDLVQEATKVLSMSQGVQDVVRVDLPAGNNGEVTLDESVHTRKRYAAELLASLYKPDSATPRDLDMDLPRGHALKELFSKYNMRRQKPGRRIAPVSVPQQALQLEGGFAGKHALWAPSEMESEEQEWLRDPLARRMAGGPPAKGRIFRRPSVADQVDTWRSNPQAKRRIQPQQISQDQSKFNPILTQAPFSQHRSNESAWPLSMECSAEGYGNMYNVDGSVRKVDLGVGENNLGGQQMQETAIELGQRAQRVGEADMGMGQSSFGRA